MESYQFGITYYSEVSAYFEFEVLDFPPDSIVMLTVDHPFDGSDLQTWYWFSDVWDGFETDDGIDVKAGVAKGTDLAKKKAEEAGIPRKLEYSTVVENERDGILDLLDRAIRDLWPGPKFHFQDSPLEMSEHTMRENFRQDVLYAFLFAGFIPADTGSIPRELWIEEWVSGRGRRQPKHLRPPSNHT